MWANGEPMSILKSGTDVLKEKPGFKLVGRDTELASMINILSRKFAHNIVLVGQSGVGCSAICCGLQEAKTDPSTPFDVMHKRIWWLDVDGMFSDADKIQESFDSMMNTISSSGDKDTILVVEDTRNFIESINNSGNTSFINRIMKDVETGRFQVIFEVRDTEIDMVLNLHSSMREQFTVMEVSPPAEDKLKAIVTAASANLSKHHGISIESAAIDQAIYLTTKYPGKERSLMRSQPEASLTLLDRSLATYRNTNHSSPAELVDIREAIKADPDNAELLAKEREIIEDWETSRQEMAAACKNQSDGEQYLNKLEKAMAVMVKDKDPENFMIMSKDEQELSMEISQVKELVKSTADKFTAMADEINSKLSLTADDVFAKFASLSGIPFDKLNEDESEKLLSLPVELKKKVFGQDHVIDQLSEAILTARTPGLKERGKPDAAFMFCGSSGVGKTALAKALAGVLKDDESAMIRYDMSEYSEKNNVTSLIGPPPGYVGFENGGTLTNAVRKNPNSIILFDEIEKAHPSIFDIFLQVLDDGRLTDTQGRTVSFEHTILIFTTNTGAEHLLDSEIDFEAQVEKTIEALSEEYRAEFLNRFGGRENIVAFKVLPVEVIEFITRCQLDKVNKDLAAAGVTLKITMSDEDITKLCSYQYKPERGARGIDGVFRTNVYPKLAKIIKKGELCDTVKVEFVDSEFILTPSVSS